ncbi:TolB protein [Kingella kingae ATCC 23330]|uniref:TolB protein n=1 Tax=Kingella kingae ATCC 23330 TaxID=887327 RepID=F5S708_KINKI|nr:TolB protein [Kingella kingae ATCC 23330]
MENEIFDFYHFEYSFFGKWVYFNKKNSGSLKMRVAGCLNLIYGYF